MSDYGPQYCDVRDPDARKQHKAVSCPDKILTAFCQLGALRLRARRCLIFFFDVNHAYIMAEATKSLSLEDDAVHDSGDEVWMGYSVIPRDVACCETTVNLPSIPITAAVGKDIMKSAFVVNDLTKHPDLSSRPYVTDFPCGRFYAGVPITTPSGVNIGAYCILDDKVRNGLAESDLIFLRDMSQTVMTHLETVRALSERQQNYRMVAGLGDFVRGFSNAGRTAPTATKMPLDKGDMGDRQARMPDALVDRTRVPETTSQLMARSSDAQRHASSTASPLRTFISSTESSQQMSDRRTSVASTSIPDSFNRELKTGTQNIPTFPAPRLRRDIDSPSDTYQRAADTLCHSLDIDGVIFLDASTQVFGGLSEAQHLESNERGTMDSDDSTESFSHSDSTPSPGANQARHCQVLGCAQKWKNEMMESNGSTDQSPRKLTESFLRRLMRRHPHGHIWTFDESLHMHSEDALSSDDSNADVRTSSALPTSPTQGKILRGDRHSEAQILQSAFPRARCIALHGIWDYSRKRWAVAGLYWTFDPLRHLAQDTDMQFVATFCDIIVAETKRLEVLRDDKAKSDFISTVSHELRSPLHGILGSCEMLFDHGLDVAALNLLEQINSCGRTLLEIIEHLLDFASLRSRHVKKDVAKSSRLGRRYLQPTVNALGGNLKASDAGVALDDLTEDAVVSSVYSFYYSQNADKYTHPPVLLDINRSDGIAWHCSLAKGGWKRVCINLVTNALKYTPSGVIQVSLKQESQPGSSSHFNAVLIVSDTGKGMSKEFQNSHLFHDFAQEDSLSDGLGLGMHMVARIIHAMGGKIDVVSDQDGSGTRVTVRVPLEHTKNDQSLRDTRDNGSLITKQKRLRGLKVGLIAGASSSTMTGNVPSSAAVPAMAAASVEKNLEFLGILSERCKWPCVESYDLMIVMEPELADCLATIHISDTANDAGVRRIVDSLTPILVVCNNSLSAQSLRSAWAKHDLRSRVIMEHVALPCGLKQLDQAISSTLSLHKKLDLTVSNDVGAYEESRDERPVGEVTMRNVMTHRPLRLQSLVASSETHEIPIIGQAWNDTTWTPPKEAGLRSNRTSLPETLPKHVPSPRTSTDDLNMQSSRTSAADPDSSGTHVPPADSPATKIPMLLLVDDNHVNLKLLATFANKHGYPHLTAQNGRIAFDAFVSAHANLSLQESSEAHGTVTINGGVPSIILMDINMPVMDGYEAVQRIRSYEKQHRMIPSKIIAVTALQSEAAEAEAFGSGFDMFLSKPLKFRDLVKLIESCL